MRTYHYSLFLTSQFYFCAFPLRLDSYNKCSFNCDYCFMKYRGGNYSQKKNIQYADTVSIDKQICRALNGDTDTAIREFLYRRVPIHFGGVSDPFSDLETDYFTTKELLKILNKYNYPTIISTRSSALGDINIISLIRSGNYIVQVSTPTDNDSNLKKLINDEHIFLDQLKMISKLKKNSIDVVCRLQPIFPNYENEYIKIINSLMKFDVDYFVFEFYKLPFENYKRLNILQKKLNYNLFDFYKENDAIAAGREWILPSVYKTNAIRNIINNVEKSSKISIGYADNDLLHLNKFNCCLGPYATKKGFENSFKYNIPMAIRKSTSNNIILNSIQGEWYPKKSINRIMNSKSRIHGDDISIKDYIKRAWNSSNHLSPEFYYGINRKQENDKAGNAVFFKSERQEIRSET